MEAVAPVLVPVVRGRVQRPVLAVVETIVRALVVARAAELAADALVLALARVPLHAQAVAATIAPVLVATLALGPVKTLPPPLAHLVATAATALAAVVAQAAVVVHLCPGELITLRKDQKVWNLSLIHVFQHADIISGRIVTDVQKMQNQ